VEEPAKELVELLTKKELSLSTAESCTGGLIAKLITDVPGASKIFAGSVVAYSNEIKQNILNVPKDIIDRYGAVSHETVEAMANNIKSIFKTDIAVSVSGIAGPGGEQPSKKTGTVCFGFAFPEEETHFLTQYFQGAREDVRMSSAVFAINYCIEYLNKPAG
jgi:nicotinamide-nucleotide amidase